MEKSGGRLFQKLSVDRRLDALGVVDVFSATLLVPQQSPTKGFHSTGH